MARAAEGWQLSQDGRTGIHQVRFSHKGRRYSFTTGERDPGAASGEAARIYAEVVSGRWSPGKTLTAPKGKPFDEVAALWLADIEPTIDPKTFTIYSDTYCARHFAPFFETIDRLTTVGAEDYIASRLRVVGRDTTNKEVSVLRRLAKWAHRRGYLEGMPEIEAVGARVLGHSAESARKGVFLIFTAEEMAAIIAELPEYATINSTTKKFSVQARFVVAWDTALRPKTIDQLSVPENYRPGSAVLTITDKMDKNRFGRELPLSEAARKALDSVCPPVGIIFGAHDYRAPLRAAAKAAGIDAYRAERISPYDFRHSRITHLGQVSSNLSGVMYLAGHRQPATTAKYMRPQKAAAEEVLQAAAAAGKPELWRHTGYKSGTAKRRISAQNPGNKKAPDSRSFREQNVELIGIEPTASRVRF